MNQELIAASRSCNPDVVLVWRGVHVLPESLRALRRESDPFLVSYNNDDPFGPLYRTGPLHLRRLWRIFNRAIPEYDLHFVYREVTREDFINAGARDVEVLLPYFIPELDRPITLSETDKKFYGSDVVFVGHFENDGRIEYLRTLVEAGVDVKLFGTGWNAENLGPLAAHFGRIVALREGDYQKALCASKSALCFLSRLNRDEYTRRCFEIPACGALLLSERTDALLRLFQEGVEALYFSSPEELLERVREVLTAPDRRQAIAAAGFERVRRDGHSVTDRMREMLAAVESRVDTN